MSNKLLKGAGWATETYFSRLRFRNFADEYNIYSGISFRIKLYANTR